MRTRKHDWLGTRSMSPIYGIQVFCDGKWMNAAVDGTPLLFKNPADRDEARKQLRKQLRQKNGNKRD